MLGQKHVEIEEDLEGNSYNTVLIEPADFLNRNIGTGVYLVMILYEWDILGQTFFWNNARGKLF